MNRLHANLNAHATQGIDHPSYRGGEVRMRNFKSHRGFLESVNEWAVLRHLGGTRLVKHSLNILHRAAQELADLFIHRGGFLKLLVEALEGVMKG
jgi:hypothetical protein